MLKLLTDDRREDFTVFCKNDIIGAVLSSRLLAYGTDSDVAMFWYSEDDEKKITSASGLFDGVFSFTANKNAPYDDLKVFPSVIGAFKIICYSDSAMECGFSGRESKVMVFCSEAAETSCEDITSENVKEIFSCIFEDDKNRNTFFPFWYTDISHKIRHGLIHGKGIFNGENGCIACALTSGETESAAVISSVSTLSQFRNKGYGKKIVLSLVSELMNKKVYIVVENELLVDWYSKMGFCLSLRKITEINNSL